MNGFPFGVCFSIHLTSGRDAPSPPPLPVSIMICLVDMFLTDRVSAFAGTAANPAIKTIREIVMSRDLFSLIFKVSIMRAHSVNRSNPNVEYSALADCKRVY